MEDPIKVNYSFEGEELESPVRCYYVGQISGYGEFAIEVSDIEKLVSCKVKVYDLDSFQEDETPRFGQEILLFGYRAIIATFDISYKHIIAYLKEEENAPWSYQWSDVNDPKSYGEMFSAAVDLGKRIANIGILGNDGYSKKQGKTVFTKGKEI